MASFSNGTEGLSYQERYCFRCEHRPEDDADGDCPIWSAHFFHSYGASPATRDVLNLLIPMVDHKFQDGLILPVAAECRFFAPRRVPWRNRDVRLTPDMACPLHGDLHESLEIVKEAGPHADCWPCHCAAVYADHGSCESER